MLRMMTLVENTSISSEYGCKHGLCIYIETPNHKILFDLGPNKLFAENALKMNVDISGCSHAGIVNIQNRAEQIIADETDMVVGGFHLYNPPTRKYESDETIDSVVISLNQKGSIYYTCHCTGPKAYKRMKAVMGDKMKYLSTGTEIIK